MARLGRAQPQKGLVKGYPPAVVAPTPAPTAPVAGGITLTGGGRHGRAAPSKPLVQYAPRPLAGGGGGDVTIVVPAIAISDTLNAPALSITLSPGPAAITVTLPVPVVTAGSGPTPTTTPGGHRRVFEIDYELDALRAAKRAREDEELLALV